MESFYRCDVPKFNLLIILGNIVLLEDNYEILRDNVLILIDKAMNKIA